jgi:hypothetical protein
LIREERLGAKKGLAASTCRNGDGGPILLEKIGNLEKRVHCLKMPRDSARQDEDLGELGLELGWQRRLVELYLKYGCRDCSLLTIKLRLKIQEGNSGSAEIN